MDQTPQPPTGNIVDLAQWIKGQGTSPGSTERYFAYAAYPNQWVTVHKATCAHCQGGRGQSGSAKARKSSDWFGPYCSREDAFKRARATGLRTVSACGHCRP
jgi:hypothetical protein